MNNSNHGFIICGTDTDVGKTIVSSLFVQGLKATYWKPIQSGTEGGTDTSRVCKTLDLTNNRYIPEIYKFKAPVSPHWAAEKENQTIDTRLLKLPLTKNFLIIETAGGLMVPLTRNWLQIDQLKEWNLPIILVARSGLGTLNHTLLSIEAIRNRNLKLIGIVLNGALHKDNPKTLKEFGGVEIIAELPHLKKINSQTLTEQWEKQRIDIKLQLSI